MTGRLSEAAHQAGIGMTMLPVLYSYAGFAPSRPSRGRNVLSRTPKAICISSR